MVQSRFLVAFAFAVLAVLCPQAEAQAQSWPQRNVRLVLPFGAGSATDVAARLMVERLSAKWGKSVVVDNRPGGDGVIAINAFTSAADDHVLLYASTASFMAHPYTLEKMSYDLDRDLLPIARVSNTVLTLAVPTATEFKTMGEFVAAVRANPNRYNVAAAAGVPEFTLEAFIKVQNLQVTKVPYRDVVQAGRDLGENRIQFLSSSHPVIRPLIEAGKVRIVALGTAGRSKVAPEVPSVIEAGFPELALGTTAGFYGPAGMPLELRRRIAADIIAVASEPTVSERIAATGQDMVPAGPEELAETLKEQAAKTASVAKVLGLQRKN